jgi:ABC-type phosphate/phosphonate transport system substrate-binding protein
MSSETRTPGQIAYEAYHAAHDPAMLWGTSGWPALPLMTRRAWEAAAQAAITAWIASPDWPTPAQKDTP